MSNAVPEGWVIATLNEFASVKGGKRLPKGKTFSSVQTKYPYVRVTDFKSGSVDTSRLRYVSESIRNQIKRYVISSDDLYISIAGTLGLVGEVPEVLDGALLTENAAKIVFNSNSNKTYFKYYLNSNEAQEHFNQAKGTGGGVPKLALFRIEDTLILCPPLPEQQKIAAILTSVDEVIEKTQAQIDKLKDLKTAMMQELLTNGVGTKQASADAALNNRTACRESYIPHTEFKDSPVGRIPKSWEVKPLSEYVSFLSYGFTNPMPESEAGPYMITAKDVYGLKIQYSKARKTTKAAYDDLLTRKSRPQVNDILLTKDGTLGRVALVEYENCCINQSVAVMTPNEKILPKFLLYLLASPSYQVEMLDKAGGSTIKHIYITIVDKMMLSVPCLSEQGRVVRIIDGLLNKIDLAEKKLLKIKNTKKALMQDLLTGKVRVKVDQ
jgi:type I restriction enzyme S subunit